MQVSEGYSTTFRYGVAVAGTVLALLVRLALDRYLGETVPYAVFFGAVAVTAWLGGFWPPR